MAEHPNAEPIRRSFEAFARGDMAGMKSLVAKTPCGTSLAGARSPVITMAATRSSRCSVGWCRRRREPSLNSFRMQPPVMIMHSH